MDNEVWRIVGGVAGIGGIALTFVAYVFKEVIRAKGVFTPVTRKHTYQLLSKIITHTSVIGILGIIAYVIISLHNGTVIPSFIAPNPSASPVSANNANLQQISPTSVESANIGRVPTRNQTTSNTNDIVKTNETPSPPLTFVVSSRVYDENGKPMPGVKVSLEDLPEYSANTESNGAFVLKGIPKKLNERAKLRVVSNGYVTQFVDIVIGRPLPMIQLERAK